MATNPLNIVLVQPETIIKGDVRKMGYKRNKYGICGMSYKTSAIDTNNI